MDYEILKIVGQIAGIGGLALGLVLLIFKEVIRKNIFPASTKQVAFKVILIVVICTWSIALAGIFAWVYVEKLNGKNMTEERSISNYAYGPILEEVKQAINAMVKDFQGDQQFRITTITSPVKGVSAVAIDPPYREFPNVIFFTYDEGAKRWKRAMEGLSIGIQPEVSGVLDLHTIGEAVDTLLPEQEDDQRSLSTIAVDVGFVAVVYDRFVHVHYSGRETYRIDKRGYSRLRKQLFPKLEVPGEECTWFDTPGLTRISLSHDSGRFTLTALTLNGQMWTVTFVGIDGGGYLDQKLISAEHGVWGSMEQKIRLRGNFPFH